MEASIESHLGASSVVAVPDSLSINCVEVDAREESAWREYVEEHPASCLGHCWEWRKVLRRAYGQTTRYLAAIDEGGSWTGVLPLVQMRDLRGADDLISMPFLDHAGILADSTAAGEALFDAAGREARRRRARTVELRERAGAASPGTRSWVPGDADRATMILDVPAGADQIWKSLDPKVRRRVRKSEESGLHTERADAARVGEFYAVLCRNMRDLGSPVHGFKFLREIFVAFSSMASLYLTSDRAGRVVGGAIGLRWKETLTVSWASSLREVSSMCSNHSLYWRILKDAAESGVRQLDFGRTDDNAGTCGSKAQWGARPHPLVWSRFSPQGTAVALKALKPGDYPGLTKVWRRLPLCVTNFLGPVIRSRLSN